MKSAKRRVAACCSFRIRFYSKTKRKPAKNNTGLWFSMKLETTCKNSAHLDAKQKKRPKFDIEWLCSDVFICATSPDRSTSLFLCMTQLLSHLMIAKLQISFRNLFGPSTGWIVRHSDDLDQGRWRSPQKRTIWQEGHGINEPEVFKSVELADWGHNTGTHQDGEDQVWDLCHYSCTSERHFRRLGKLILIGIV